ncbi:hypothetical protein [Caulobacter sp. 17J65-9]|uniref:hypothetical protein n=1 Tax=Caulobacter sp. 17J65-9 TaxID=2709382 RepID=UPI0013CD3311|nr:hypothetical protein [Caulobacter sp. 17J65-9]NEX93478.1 hypothetical protein [Caulobacter sp. 17J65-9]
MRGLVVGLALALTTGGAASAAAPSAVGEAISHECLPFVVDRAPAPNAGTASDRLVTIDRRDGDRRSCVVKMVASPPDELPAALRPSAIRAELSKLFGDRGYTPVQAPPPRDFAFRDAYCSAPGDRSFIVLISGTADDNQPTRALFVTLAETPGREAFCP